MDDDEPTDHPPGSDANTALEEFARANNLTRMELPEGEGAPGIALFLGVPELLFTARADGGRRHLTILAKPDWWPSAPNAVPGAEPAVCQLVIEDMDDDGSLEREVAELSDHPSVEAAKARADEFAGLSIVWQPYVGFPDDAG